MILDTSFLIDLMNGDPAALDVADEIDASSVTQHIPAQAVYELYVGVGYTDTPRKEQRRIEAVLSSRPIVETTTRVARKAGRIDGQLRSEGRRVDSGDLIIGAVGLVLDEPVITGNPDHFARIPDLAVETY